MSVCRCPACGAPLTISAGPSLSTHGVGRSFDFTVPFHQSAEISATPSDFESWTREQPSRQPTPASDVAVPFLQALGCGVFAGLAGSAAALIWHWSALVPLGTFISISSVAWFVLLVDHRHLLRSVETIINRDIDRDGQIGEQQPKRTLRVELEKDGKLSRIIDGEQLGIDDEDLIAFAKDVLANGNFTEGYWSKKFKGGILAYRDFRGRLETAGLISRNGIGKNASFGLTVAGRSIMRGLILE